MMNKAILIGRLTRDPEVRYTQAGEPVTSFTVAIDRNYTRQDGTREADFIPIVCFKRVAETAGKYLAKGRLVAVSGRIQTRNYTAQDGGKRYVTEVVADEVRFLERAPEGSAPRELPTSSSGGRSPRLDTESAGFYPDDDQNNFAMTPIDEDDDLPF